MKWICILLCGLAYGTDLAQESTIDYIPARIDFNEKIQDWDGFGFNYVETAQTRDYQNKPQDYGGFNLLDTQEKEEIAALVFGEDGLQVQIVKMFLDPFHQVNPDSDFDHKWTTQQMRSFVESGLDLSKQRGEELEIITTLYGPPAWATKQKLTGGRDLDPKQKDGLCEYIIDWIRYLKSEDYPVKYLSLHNEGEDFYRWFHDTGLQRFEKFDYNMYWSPEQVNQFLNYLPKKLKAAGLEDIGMTNGEPSNWTRFYQWGYTDAMLKDEGALKNLDLLTTHGFINGNTKRLAYGTANGLSTNLLRQKKPGLHCWITSYSWGGMGNDFVRMAHEQIYTARVNALIPWAGVQNPTQWYDGDPNSGCAIRVNEDGTYEVLKGYYFYKQLTRAGYRGMSVVNAWLANPLAFIIAFGSNGSGHPDAFVVSSDIRIWSLPIRIEVSGSSSKRFRAYRSSEDGKEQFTDIGVFELTDGTIIYDPPLGTSTTFIGIE